MTERAYTMGLPVVVTVDDDGRVTWSVDVSETSLDHDLDIEGGWSEEDEAHAVVDQEAIQRVLARMDGKKFQHFTHPVEFSTSIGWWLSQKA